MQDPSDGIAEEVERQLQLALAAAAIVARRTIATRHQAIEQAQHDSAQRAQALKAQIDADRQLAAAHLQPVFDPGWWETAAPRDVADMWQEANSWRDPDRDVATPTIFDHAAGRIRQEVRDRTGLDATQVLALAAVQDLEHEHQATLVEHDSVRQAAELEAVQRDSIAAPRGYDDPHRREQLRIRLVAAGVPEPAIEARTLADLGQAREAAEAAHTPVATAPGPRPGAARSASRELRRQR
jgi:hypothetical protein